MELTKFNQSLDKEIGKKLRSRREKLFQSLAEFSDAIGINQAQIQRYEQGIERIPANRLLFFTMKLNVELSYFFEKLTNIHNVAGNTAAPLKILIVEDNAIDKMLLQDALLESKTKYQSYMLQNGNEALDYLRQDIGNNNAPFRLPDIIILDLNLPGIHGYEILKEIQKNMRLKDIPVIILTNSVHYKDLERSYELKASGFITKSLSIKKLKNDIVQLIHYWTSVLARPQNS